MGGTELDIGRDEFDRECKIVEMYIDSAKSYSQLSTGALALAAVFGSTNFRELGAWLLVACVFFLIAALASGAYQALAVGRLEDLSGLPIGRGRIIPASWRENAYVCYNVMVGSFHMGAISLAVVSVVQRWPRAG